MARVCRIVVVTEGWEDRAFLEGFLSRAGIDARSIERRTNPKGRGSGHSYVREVFAEEISALSRFSEGRGVVALMDEDGKGLETRRSWVAALLQSRNLPPMDCTEGRCLLIPKRNIETWAYWIAGLDQSPAWMVDEIVDYKKQRPQGAARPLEGSDWAASGKRLHALDHTTAISGMPMELSESLRRLRHFLKAVKR